jgi:hypothetical protein
MSAFIDQFTKLLQSDDFDLDAMFNQLETAGVVSPEAAGQRRRNEAKTARDKELYEYNERGQRVFKDQRPAQEQAWEERKAGMQASQSEAEARSAEARAPGQQQAAENAARMQGQRGATGSMVDTESDAYKAGQELTANRNTQAAEKRETDLDAAAAASPMAAVVAGLKGNENFQGERGTAAREAFSEKGGETLNPSMGRRFTDEAGNSYRPVRQDLGGGNFVESKVYDPGTPTDKLPAGQVVEGGKARPISEVTKELVKSQETLTAPGIAKVYENAARQQANAVPNNGFTTADGRRNSLVDELNRTNMGHSLDPAIAGQRAVADPMITRTDSIRDTAEKRVADLTNERARTPTAGMQVADELKELAFTFFGEDLVTPKKRKGTEAFLQTFNSLTRL